MSVHFSDHAAWRTAERHGGSVYLGDLAEEIEAALEGGWSTRRDDGVRVVTIRSGERFVVKDCDNGAVVVTALGSSSRGR